jgi:urea transport system ATP-binding protein
MDFMRAYATSVTVMAGGRVLSEGTVAEVQADPRVQEVYLGTVNSLVAALAPEAGGAEFAKVAAEVEEQEP